MPKKRKGESPQDFVRRCVSYVVHTEGKPVKEAIGKCLGMSKQRKKRAKKK